MSSITYNHIKAYKVLANAYFKDRCVECHSSKVKLVIHHKDGNSSNNKINNLTLLCNRCHGKAHWDEDRSKKRKAVCKKCGWSWNYGGKNPLATCPSCGNKVKVREIGE